MTLRDILVRAGDATFAHFDILRERYLSLSLTQFFRLYTLDALALKRWRIYSEKKNVHVGWLNCSASQICHAKVARLFVERVALES